MSVLRFEKLGAPGRGATAALIVVLLVAGAGAFLAGATFPRRRGRLSVSGCAGRVSIETDALGVPTIRAGSLADLLFGLGYVHARDRLWQMEFQRRIGSGRLAEALGEGLVRTDRFLRTVGFRRAAEDAWRSTREPARSLLAAYARGVNAFLASDSSRPIELRLLSIHPEPFTPVDSLVWAKMMAWDLAGNAGAEIRRRALVDAVGPARTAELLPPVPEEPTILEDSDWSGAVAPRAAAPPAASGGARAPAALLPRLDLGGFATLFPPGGEIGSNSWVVAGSRTASGRPLLANDPHLALRTPSVWYLARLESAGVSLVGATLPGLPAVIIGKNARIAWGVTSLEPDVQDLFVEEIDPRYAGRYFHRGVWKRFDERREEIRVRGSDPVVFTVRMSVHGPIVSDVLPGAARLGPAVALSWTGLDPDDHTAEAFLGIDLAGGWSDFLRAVALLHAPAQNFVYADVDGHIGYTASGAIPIRPRADGLLPVSGVGDDDWTGVIPFERLPRVLDPERGFIVTANNRVVSERYPYSLARDWPEPYRARRIRDLLQSSRRLDPAAMRAIQADRVSYQARDLLPLLLRTSPRDAASAEALARLAAWSGDFAPDSVPASIYAVWYAALARMADDELGGMAAGPVRSRFLIHTLATNGDWCDDVTTPRKETCTEFASATLQQAVATLERRLGRDPNGWRWERLHRARFPHGAFDRVALLRPFFSLETGQGGDASTVNVGAYRLDGSFLMTDGPSYRQVIDLANPDGSTFVHPGGQSGNVFDRRYRDFVPLWRADRQIPMRAAGTADVLELVPR